MSIKDDNYEYQEIENYVNRIEKKNKFSMMIIAQLSSHYFSYAKKNILKFFNNQEKFTTIGYSSNSMRSHHLYKSIDNTYYEIHYSYGKYSTCVYLTQNMISIYFEEGEEVPTFHQPLEVQKYIDDYYEANKEFNSYYEEINI